MNFHEIYTKKANEMYRLKALAEAARKRGDTETARMLRREYTNIKAEIDAAAFKEILSK